MRVIETMANGTKPVRVLVVEDDPTHCELVAHCLGGADVDFAITFAGSCAQATTILHEDRFDCVVLDHSLPDGTGDQLLSNSRFHLLTTPIVAYSTSLDHDVIVSELRGGCVDFIPKRDAFVGRKLEQTILTAIERNAVRAAVERSGSSAQQIERAGSLLDFDSVRPLAADESLVELLQTIYETAVRTIQDGVLLVERRSRIVFANPAFKRLVGLSGLTDLPGHPLTTVRDVLAPAAAAKFEGRETTHRRYESLLRTSDGREVPVMIGETPLGQHGTLLAVTDLSEIKATQKELEHKNRRLTELNATANRFVDDVSHEFRTPLTVIKGFAELMDQGIAGPVTDQQREFFQTILDRTRDLTQMVDDLLDTSKLRAGCLRVDRVRLTADDVLGPLQPAIVQKAEVNRITVCRQIEPDLPEFYGDAEKIGRVMLNLIVNAIKFSSEGSEVVIWARTHGENEVEIGVTDHGPGISRDNLRLVFERFKQVGDPQRSSTKGFGLGLSIAVELAAMNLGAMQVESEPGVGSTFSVRVPRYDHRAILERYIQQQTSVQSDPVPLTVLRVGSSCAHAVDPGELRAFVISNTWAMDLVFEGAADGALLLVGFSGKPERWAQRLGGAWRDATRDHDDAPAGAIEVSVVNRWPWPPDESAVGRILQQLGGETE